jgi:uncharacterized protein (DUF2236 family)
VVLRGSTTRELALADIIGEACMGLGAGSTVMLQLALRPVGLGVAEHSATLNRPLDRLRTTATFVTCMVLGTESERRAIARMVNKAHVPVRSEQYDAFDPSAQLWVAATLARNSEQIYERTFGPFSSASRERIYRDSWVFGTVLQVTPDMWPPTREAFEDYWTSMQSQLSAEPGVQDYARQLFTTRGKPLVAKPLMPLQSLMTRGNLTPEQRALLGLPWSARDQKRYDLFWRWFPRVYRHVPRFLRTLGTRVNLLDMRLRMRLGRRVI